MSAADGYRERNLGCPLTAPSPPQEDRASCSNDRGDVDLASDLRGLRAGGDGDRAGADRAPHLQPRDPEPQVPAGRRAGRPPPASPGPPQAEVKPRKGGWARKLAACRSPSTESLQVKEPNARLRRSASSEGRSAQGYTTACAATFTPGVTESPLLGARAETLGLSVTAGGRSIRFAPFCPCLSPAESDAEEVAAAAAPTSDTRRGIRSLARELRMRMVRAEESPRAEEPVAAAAADPGVMVAEPYPVHTQVEYTHYLVPDLSAITGAPYYWGVMDRFEAERLLEGKAEGTFLLRDSAQTEYLFSVSFRRYQRTLHARIEQMNHRFSFDSYDPGVFSAASVTLLIEHYKDPAKCLFFEPQLSTPLVRGFPFSLQHLCRAAAASSLNGYESINILPVPKDCKDYLREYHYKQAVRIRNMEK